MGSQPQFPFFIPLSSPEGGGGGDPGVSESPARVRTAMEYLAALSYKTMTRVAMNSTSIEEIAGQKLIASEVDAQIAACELLESYFRGESRLDQWEKETLKGLAAPNNVSGPGITLRCIVCSSLNGPPRPDCKLCNGSGMVLVFPLLAEQPEEEE